MLTANLYHIKRTNGLYYYAVDYLRETKNLIRSVFARPEIAPSLRDHVPGVDVVSTTLRGAIASVYKAHSLGDFIFTPTSHPYPFASHQMIVLHDPYPFLGLMGRVKRQLLKASLSLSKCHVAYINTSEGLRFLHDLGLADARLVFAPNKLPESPTFTPVARERAWSNRIGLVGTDSRKKNYEGLLSSFLQKNPPSDIEFHILGHSTPYLSSIQRKFPTVAIKLRDSATVGLQNFLNDIDVLVSVANHEGFGRPLAVAIQMGVPCLLLRRPVFEEFFTHGAMFSSDVDALTDKLIQLTRGAKSIASTPGVLPHDLEAAFTSAAMFLRLQASGR